MGRRTITSNEEGALYYGSAAYLFSKYGIGHRMLLPPTSLTPWPDIPTMDDLPDVPQTAFLGKDFVSNAQRTILVPARTPGVDPRGSARPPSDLGADWKTGVDGGMRFDPVNVPAWAEYGSKGVFVVGAGLTLYGTWESSWQDDEALHPNWSQPERIADAAQTTVVEGGASPPSAAPGRRAGGRRRGRLRRQPVRLGRRTRP